MPRAVPAIILAAACVTAARSQVVIVPPGPQLGSADPITAEPPVVRPSGVPCTVLLFSELEFADFNPKTFNYAPPANCPGPWAKVVFTADFTVTAGNQFDRTAAFYLGHANIFYGTTAEPSTSLSPSWHVERDVTDLTSLLRTAQAGEADLDNFVGTSGGVVYNGLIYANAALEFYPLTPGAPAPDTPDVVIPLPDAAGGAVALDSGTSQLSQSISLPPNTERVFLDVIAQSQSDDEFWYTCVPNDVASELQSCGNTGFRETEVSIDDQPAGVAPVYPWIYTGGIDPFLWQPITGVQTLDFKPYRVDLTPFAGLLGNGQAHTLAISVYNANNYFLATANLLVYADHGATQVTGAVLSNSLTALPSPVVKEHLTTDASGNLSGSVVVSSSRRYAISGYVDTSHGRVETTVDSHVDFKNLQTFVINAASYIQNITQTNSVDSLTTVTDGSSSHSTHTQLAYPFTFEYSYIVQKSGASAQATSADQQYLLTVASADDRSPGAVAEVRSEVKSADVDHFDASGNFTGNSGQTSSAEDLQRNSRGHCFARTLSAAKGVLTDVRTSLDCAAVAASAH